MKVKLTKLFHPNISKLTTENGGRGTHFAKFLISLFQWGLTHSAMCLIVCSHLPPCFPQLGSPVVNTTVLKLGNWHFDNTKEKTEFK